ncbi:MAG: cell division protein ZapA [Bacteroidia bacterium]|nr:cell division protein ZapA [Bacteroidia bacterium]MDW8302821.1 cell division protein ZapA [Bacteroidia bacterium]
MPQSSETKSIEITILGRSYPIIISPEDQDLILAAGALVERKMRQIIDKFSLRDALDAPVMTALQYAVISLIYKQELEQAKSIYPDLEALLNKIEQEISRINNEQPTESTYSK